MVYNWALIKDLVKINKLITLAEKEVRNYSFRISNADFQNAKSVVSTEEMAMEITTTQTELDEVNALILKLIAEI